MTWPFGEQAACAHLERLIVDFIAVDLLDAGVEDGDQVDARLMKLLRQAGHVREAIKIYGEDPIAVHVVDIQMHGAQGKFVEAVPIQHGLDVLLAPVAPP